MLKMLVSLAVLSAALLTSSMAFASPASADDEAFLASLQAPQTTTALEAPALSSTDRTPVPTVTCTFDDGCTACVTSNGGFGQHYCYTCNGVKTCGRCALTCGL
jgi:hypothetical protein